MSSSKKRTSSPEQLVIEKRIKRDSFDVLFWSEFNEIEKLTKICEITPSPSDTDTSASSFGAKVFQTVVDFLSTVVHNSDCDPTPEFFNSIVINADKKVDQNDIRLVDEFFRFQFHDKTNEFGRKSKSYENDMFCDEACLLLEWKLSDIKTRKDFWTRLDEYSIHESKLLSMVEKSAFSLTVIPFTRFKYFGQIKNIAKKTSGDKVYYSSNDWEKWPIYAYVEFQPMLVTPSTKDDERKTQVTALKLPYDEFTTGIRQTDIVIDADTKTCKLYCLSEMFGQFTCQVAMTKTEQNRIQENLNKYLPSVCKNISNISKKSITNNTASDPSNLMYLKIHLPQTKRQNASDKSQPCFMKLNKSILQPYNSQKSMFETSQMIFKDSETFRKEYVDDLLYRDFYEKFGFCIDNTNNYFDNRTKVQQETLAILHKVTKTNEISESDAIDLLDTSIKQHTQRINMFPFAKFLKSYSLYDAETLQRITKESVTSNKSSTFQSKLEILVERNMSQLFSNRLDAFVGKGIVNAFVKIHLTSIVYKSFDLYEPKFTLQNIYSLNSTPSFEMS